MVRWDVSRCEGRSAERQGRERGHMSVIHIPMEEGRGELVQWWSGVVDCGWSLVTLEMLRGLRGDVALCRCNHDNKGSEGSEGSQVSCEGQRSKVGEESTAP